MHPILGETEAQKSLQTFMRQSLRIPTTELGECDVVSVHRMRSGRGRGKQTVGEAVIVFVNVETRDRVCSYAKNLAAYVDREGKPTAGVRMYIPTHLGGVHKTLLQYGHNMREKYGPSLKHNIRFDDSEQTLCVDIKLPDSERWVTVSHDLALMDRRAWNRSIKQTHRDTLCSRPSESAGALCNAAPALGNKACPGLNGTTVLLPNGDGHMDDVAEVLNEDNSCAMEEGVWGRGK